MPQVTLVTGQLQEINLSPLETDGWTASTPIACAAFDEIQLQVTGLSGGDSLAVQGGVTSSNLVNLTGVDMSTNTTITSITANGNYSFPACGYNQYTKTGSASNPTVNLLRK